MCIGKGNIVISLNLLSLSYNSNINLLVQIIYETIEINCMKADMMNCEPYINACILCALF